MTAPPELPALTAAQAPPAHLAGMVLERDRRIRRAKVLGSAATAGEGAQNTLCAYLAIAVLFGLALNEALGLWRADPVVALGIGAFAIPEGRETWRGEGCCAAAPMSELDPSHGCDHECPH